MFYLKYRPQKFSELIKPNVAAESLAKQVKTEKVSHAYLFTGSRGTGKTTTARILAKAVNCLSPLKSGDPCDECENCVAIKRGNFLDLIEIDAASNRGIDDIRSLRDRIKLAPAHGKKKVYIIDEVHMLTKEAFNALLKTLEEPPAHALFILCTTEASKVPDTIKSRCQSFSFKRATLDQLKEKLQLIAAEEGEELSDVDALDIARASMGGYRDAETMLQQVLEGDLKTASLVGSNSYDEFLNFVDYLTAGSPAGAFEFLEAKYSQGSDMQLWAGSLLEYLKKLLFVKMGAVDLLLDVPAEILERMKVQAESLEVKYVTKMTNLFLDAYNKVGETGLGTLPLELAVAEMCSAGSGEGHGDGDGTGGPESPVGSKGGAAVEEKSEDPPAGGPVADSSAYKASAEISPEASTDNSPAAIDIDSLMTSWNDILRAATKYNHSVRALLKATKPLEVVGNSVTLEARFAFHKDRLEYSKNREIVERVFFEVLEIPLTFTCCVEEVSSSKKKKKKLGETGNLTDLNLVIPEGQDLGSVSIDASLLDVFDGGLPL